MHKADFDALLSSPIVARSTHFALHRASFGVGRQAAAPQALATEKLSTSDEPRSDDAVDNKGEAWALGCVLPKRHARRAVTRNLLRREIKQAFAERAVDLSPGRYLMRLRTALPLRQFPAAASRALRNQVRAELVGMLDRVSPSSRPSGTAR